MSGCNLASGLEHELLKVPAESLAQLMRTQHKLIEKQMVSTLSTLATAAAPARAGGDVSRDAARAAVQ
eukprot:6930875-Prymnesium_polylepis.1